MTYLDSLQVFHGEVNPARARIYARVAPPATEHGWRLAGQVSGPHNALASTLPATVPLRDLGPGPTLLAEAVLPDPCYWTPESPALYEVAVTLLDEGNRPREIVTRQIGIRSFGIRGASFYLEGKRWVMRGADRALAPSAPAAAWRDAWAAPLVELPDDEFLGDSSRLGVLTVVELAGAGEQVEKELRRLSRWAAVAIAVIDCTDPLDKSAAPNVLLGWQIKEYASAIPGWATVVFAEASSPKDFAQQVAKVKQPVVALRRLDNSSGLAEARTACDELQRDLAPFGDYAGYMIIPASKPPIP